MIFSDAYVARLLILLAADIAYIIEYCFYARAAKRFLEHERLAEQVVSGAQGLSQALERFGGASGGVAEQMHEQLTATVKSLFTAVETSAAPAMKRKWYASPIGTWWAVLCIFAAISIIFTIVLLSDPSNHERYSQLIDKLHLGFWFGAATVISLFRAVADYKIILRALLFKQCERRLGSDVIQEYALRGPESMPNRFAIAYEEQRTLLSGLFWYLMTFMYFIIMLFISMSPMYYEASYKIIYILAPFLVALIIALWERRVWALEIRNVLRDTTTIACYMDNVSQHVTAANEWQKRLIRCRDPLVAMAARSARKILQPFMQERQWILRLRIIIYVLLYLLIITSMDIVLSRLTQLPTDYTLFAIGCGLLGCGYLAAQLLIIRRFLPRLLLFDQLRKLP